MNGIRVGNLFGIPFYINPSWFLVFGLVTFLYGSDLSRYFNLSGPYPWILGMVTAILMFSSVLLHELGHSFVAMSQGIEVKSITLFIFGGLASLGEESKTPGDAFWVAIAGPLVSFSLFGVFTAIGIFVDPPQPYGTIVGLLAYINLILGAFNLIPGLPLDGGNILKSLVWKITDKPYRGVAFASRVGQVFGWAGIILGANAIFGLTESLFGVQLFGSAWTLLIGLFLLQNAGRTAQSAEIQERMSGLTAADGMYPDSPIVSADLSLREFANNHVIGSQTNWKKYLVTDADGKLIGQVEVDDMKSVSTNDWWDVRVRSLMKPIQDIPTVQADEPLIDVIARLEKEKAPALIVQQEEGRVIGLLERISIMEMMQRRASEEESLAQKENLPDGQASEFSSTSK